ncbi:MAG TPA: hypothetical protein DDW50_08100 [Firmicutes bacterium]|jgi:type IV pilus assembly protein PilM|nr:hypothetical protein [Bacillota bacterium]
MARIGIGVDIGRGSVKIIQLTSKKGQVELTGYAKIIISPDSMDDEGMVASEALMAEAIHQACLQARVRSKKVFSAVAGNAVVMKALNLPVMIGPQLGEVIRFETEKFLTFPITEAEYDWDILQQHDNGEMELMIVAAPKKIITSQLTCFQRAGLQTVAIDTQTFCNMRALAFDIDSESSNLGGIVILDVGVATTKMAIFYAGSIRETRIINIAGQLITRELAEQMQISLEKAEAIKCNLGDADYNFIESESDTESYKANQIIGGKLAELVVEIRRSLDYFKLQYPETPIHQFILTGGSSKLRNLASYLERELGIGVKLGNPLTGLQIASRQINRAVILGNPYQFSVAIGLALRGVEYS